ncbi:Nucleoid-associated protein YgaU, contains BON and LysM domains [Formosa sp. Hel1_31_208]|uniref:peptidoglycan-binding protein LysM n=1 Tax=Formosa sp. Hel1_31_208 TaxID=1798225 RepID=UPI00087C44F5|nr:peptidoglycan-binding protein LysM [Formosa sp. Hel1_31_208]SDR69530.1 Nucleoid-associated protein YgaU, contains BON and LysM domains [Formosa sp. Hel1_31_208]
MGLFTFINDAGAKVFGIGKTLVTKTLDVRAKEKVATESELDRREEAAARNLEETISDLRLQVENLHVFIDLNIALVSGKAYDQSTREKVVLVIGNTAGIALVDDQMSVEHVEPEAQFHTVERGDTLGKIAKHYYGNAMKYAEIFEANQPMLTDPDKIYPGKVLRIPNLN